MVSIFDTELAFKNILYECACSAWTKERLIDALNEAVNGNVIVDREANDPEKYIKAYKGCARDILNEINTGKLSF